ncbi:MAG: putative Ig domain-containing protein, partial [Polyangiaceae bacterium]
LVLNEVDYDNVGTDLAEFVEIYNGTGAPVDLAPLALVLVNGADGTEYTRVALGPGTLAAGQYLVVADNAVTLPGGADVIRFAGAANQIQNGSPDGIALINQDSESLVDALSYGGSITAANITGFASPVSLVEGNPLPLSVADSNTVDGSLARVPNGSDTDDAATDWTFMTTPTPGEANGAGSSIPATGCSSADHPPTLQPIGDKSVTEGQLLTFGVSATDPDSSDTLTYSASNLPSDASFDPGTRAFSWTPTAAQVGTYPLVHFSVSDGTLSDAGDITITVAPAAVPPPDHPPTLQPVGDKSVTEGQLLTFGVSATDPDSSDTLTYSASNLPSGARFDPATHTFSWIPSSAQVGSYPNVGFTVTDGTATASGDITITVNPGTSPAARPQTVLTSHPKRRIGTKAAKASVRFKFRATGAGTTFQCKLDSGAYKACRSPKSYKVRRGKHVFAVRAHGRGGFDLSPATFHFTVVSA